jgi:hypothetical protein
VFVLRFFKKFNMLRKNEKYAQNFGRKDLIRRVTSEVLGAGILVISNGKLLTGLFRS